MTTQVLLTIDTELLWRHHAAGLSWEENFARSYEAAGVGVPFQLETLARHELKACFFVDPMPALVHGLEPVRRMVSPILDAGQEVQLHLHPFWESLAGDRPARAEAEFELTGLDAPRQQALIEQARDLLMQAGAPAPIAFRSGSYAADPATLKALSALGFRYDSSHNGCAHPWPSALPLDPAQIVPVAHGGLIEVPVSQIAARPGKLRHLQICAVSLQEMRAALDHARRAGHPLATIVSHSFELATRDGRRVNRTILNRFTGLCAYLAEHRDQLPTASFLDLGGLPLGVDARPLAGRPLLRTRRLAEQVWSGARYERPVEAATATWGSSIHGIEALIPALGL
jgi:hypothetical protein